MADIATLMRTDPGAALRLLQEAKEFVVVPHEGQKQVLSSPARFKVLNAGRRWGKTKIGVKSMLDAAHAPSTKKNPQSSRLIWWVAPTYKVVKRGYREALRQIPKQLLAKPAPPETNFDAGRSVTLHLKTGTSIEFYSAERPAGMLGEGVDYVVVDEAALMPSTVWEQTIRPTLADTGGHGLLISTPRGRNWFYRRWLDGQKDKAEQWASWTFPSASNPYLPEDEIQAMKDELPLRLFEQEVEARFLAAGSSVFIWEDTQVERKLPLENGMLEDVTPKGQVFLGIDLAKTTDYTVLYGANENDMRNVFFDRFNSVRWSEQKRRIRRAVSQLRKKGAENVTLVMDSTGVGDPIVEEMEDNGYDVIGVNFTGTKNKMVSRFAKDLENGKALILEEHLDEFENYQMDATPRGVITFSAPEGEHDDVVSAKILQHWGIATEGAPDVTTVTASQDDSFNPRNPDAADDDDFAEDWSDLVDDGSPGADYYEDATRPELVQRIGPQPTPEQLLNNPDAWT